MTDCGLGYAPNVGGSTTTEYTTLGDGQTTDHGGCAQCANGFYSDQTDLSPCSTHEGCDTNTGKVSAIGFEASVDCHTCPSNQYSSSDSTSVCHGPATGTVVTSTSTVACAAGYAGTPVYSDATGSYASGCVACAAATEFTDVAGEATCKTVPASMVKTSNTALECAAGHGGSAIAYTSTSATGCSACPAGMYKNTAGTVKCSRHCVGAWSADTCLPDCNNVCTPTLTYTQNILQAGTGNACPHADADTMVGTTRTGIICPVNCVGAWSADTCDPVCDYTCTPTQTYTISRFQAGTGTHCDHSDAATKTGTMVTAELCPVACVGSWSPDNCDPVCNSECTPTLTYTVHTFEVNGGGTCDAASGMAGVVDGSITLGTTEIGIVCPVDCAGSWSTNTCDPVCNTDCRPTLTYTINRYKEGAGAECDFTNGATKDGPLETGAVCPEACEGAWSTNTCDPVCNTDCTPTLTYTVTHPEVNGGGACTSDGAVVANGANKNGPLETGAICPVNCVGSWSTGTCSPRCDQTCTFEETYTHTTDQAGTGTHCTENGAIVADGAIRRGPLETGITCPRDCVGSWSTGTCSPRCGQTCTFEETYTHTTLQAGTGTHCRDTGGDTNGATRRGPLETGITCPVNCEGGWSAEICTAECNDSCTPTQTYTHTTGQAGTGTHCRDTGGHDDGTTRHGTTVYGITCPVDCDGSWSVDDCTASCDSSCRPTLTYTHNTLKEGAGDACPYTDGQETLGTTRYGAVCPRNCGGEWEPDECNPSCGTTCRPYRRFSITTTRRGYGRACDEEDVWGTTRTGITCPVNCVGSWSAETCTAGCGSTCTPTQTYTHTTLQAGTGSTCPHTDGETRNGPTDTGVTCPITCYGTWSTETCTASCESSCTPIQTFTIHTYPAGTGGGCETHNGATRHGTTDYGAVCSRDCVGTTWDYHDNCSPSCGSSCTGTKYYYHTTAATGGGAACPYASWTAITGTTRYGATCSVNCEAEWRLDSTCNPSCGQSCRDQYTYKHTVLQAGSGTHCYYADGQAGVGPVVDGPACYVPPSRPWWHFWGGWW
jgi:hypothetical protein